MRRILTTVMVVIATMLLLQACGTTEPDTTEVCNPWNAIVPCKAVSPKGAKCTYTTYQVDCKCKNSRHSWNIP